jgi:hypothetical protein
MKRILATGILTALVALGMTAITPAFADHDFADVTIVKLVAETGEDPCGGTDHIELNGTGLVNYCYVITNNGEDIEIESLVDDKLGNITVPDDELSAGEQQEITFGEVAIDEDTTNVATLTVFDVDESGEFHRQQFTASATVTVTETQDAELPQLDAYFGCNDATEGIRLFVTITNPDPDTDALVDLLIGDTPIDGGILVPAGGTVKRDYLDDVLAGHGNLLRIVGSGSAIEFDTLDLTTVPVPACPFKQPPTFTG